MSSHFRIVSLACALTVCSSPLLASDARSIALGGSAIANGKGAHGAFDNPASMMQMQRRSETVHLRFGFSGEYRDPGNTIDEVSKDDNKDLFKDIENEVDSLSDREIQCDPITGNGDDVCIDQTQSLSDLATRTLTVIDTLKDNTILARINGDLGLAITHTPYPFAVNLHMSGTAGGQADITQGDREYIQEFATLLDNNSLTLDEIRNSQYFEADALGIPLGVRQPEDVLNSRGYISVLLRRQLAVSMASAFTVKGYDIDAGITPKVSTLRAYRVELDIADEFEDDTDSVRDRLEDAKVTESTFTFDAGASMELPVKPLDEPIRVAAVLRNVIPESIKSADGTEFKTTPQLILGSHFQRGMLSLTGDLALNEAKVDGLDTQKVAIGIELGTRMLSARAGISIDAARRSEKSTLSLGFGLGPLQIGTRLGGSGVTEVGMQLSHSFL